MLLTPQKAVGKQKSKQLPCEKVYAVQQREKERNEDGLQNQREPKSERV